MVNEHLQRIALSTATIAGLLSEMTIPQLARVFGTSHLEVMEAMIKADPGFRSKHLLRKLNLAIGRILDGRSTQKQNLRCVVCKNRRRDVRPRVDSYRHEIEGKKVRRNLCRGCAEMIKEEV